jgi:hypothetical protein
MKRLFACTLLVALAGLLGVPAATADNAPMWESSVGLTPGAATTIRMQSEDVSLQIVERGSAAVAVVDATFDMNNPGPMTRLLIGFPNFVYGALPSTDAFSPVFFTPANLTNFRAWTDSANYSPAIRQVAVGQFGGSDWFVWSMPYPPKQLTHVHVAYEQKLNEQLDSPFYRPIVHATYVLRTGALWADTIGKATVTFTAPDGGGFVGAEKTAEASDSKLVWQFSDFKPTFDPDAAYIYRAPWQELKAAEARVAAPDAAPADFLRAAQAAIKVLGTDGPYAQPPVLVERYAAAMRSWANKATELGTPEAWEIAGDVEHYAAMPTTKNHGELACWPDAGAAAYERAAALGSASAAEKRASLDTTVIWMKDVAFMDPVQSCS